MLQYFLIAVAILVLLVVMMSVKIVSQGYRYTIERFGRFVRVAEPGLNHGRGRRRGLLPGHRRRQGRL